MDNFTPDSEFAVDFLDIDKCMLAYRKILEERENRIEHLSSFHSNPEELHAAWDRMLARERARAFNNIHWRILAALGLISLELEKHIKEMPVFHEENEKAIALDILNEIKYICTGISDAIEDYRDMARLRYVPDCEFDPDEKAEPGMCDDFIGAEIFMRRNAPPRSHILVHDRINTALVKIYGAILKELTDVPDYSDEPADSVIMSNMVINGVKEQCKTIHASATKFITLARLDKWECLWRDALLACAMKARQARVFLFG